jgi:hypothetical protein
MIECHNDRMSECFLLILSGYISPSFFYFHSLILSLSHSLIEQHERFNNYRKILSKTYR